MKKVTAERYFNAMWAKGKRNIDQLTQDEQKCLTGLIMREKLTWDQWEFIAEPKNSNETIYALSDYLISFDLQERDDEEFDGTPKNFMQNHKYFESLLSTAISRNASDYGRYFINEMFQQRMKIESRNSGNHNYFIENPEITYGTDYRR